VKFAIRDLHPPDAGAIYKGGFVAQRFERIEKVYQCLHGVPRNATRKQFPLIPPFIKGEV
jgi:hypothetical protein